MRSLSRLLTYLVVGAIACLGLTVIGSPAQAVVDNTGQQDPTFTPASLAGNQRVNDTAVQDDGKSIIGGDFTDLGGDSATDFIGRLNSDGSRDATFTPAALNSKVFAIAVLPDGKILVGGNFTSPGQRLVRLNADGTLDNTFTPAALNGQVNVITVQSDGKLLVGGQFQNAGSDSNADYLVRLNPDGTLDSAFTAAAPVLNYYVEDIVVQSDDKIVIGGWFTNVGVSTRDYVARLAGSGALDTGFVPPTLNDYVYSVAVDGSGRIVIGGEFDNADSNPVMDYVIRMGSDGTLDTGFVPLTLGTDVYSVALVAGGKVLVGGRFQNAGGDPATDYLARANSDGSRDTAFAPVTLDSSVRTVRYLSDGKYLIGGQFGNTGYVGVNRLGVTIPSPGPLAFSPDPLAFGNVAVGAAETKTVTVTNNGTAAMTPSAITPAGTGVSVTGGTCAVSTPVGVGASCTIEVQWIPAATGSLSGGSVTVEYPDGDQPSGSVSVTGTGVVAGPLGFSPDPLAFGNVAVGAAETKTVTVTNNGTAAMTPSAITPAGTGVSVTGGTCAVSTPVPAGQTCTVQLTWTPAAVGALSGGSVTVLYPNGIGSGEAVEVTGNGVRSGPLTFAPDPVDFGNVKVGDSSDVSVTVANTGTAAVKPMAITAAGADVEVTGGTCATGSNIPSGGSCTVVLTWSPTAEGELSGGSLTLAYAGGDTPSNTVTMSGDAIAAEKNAKTPLQVNTGRSPAQGMPVGERSVLVKSVKTSGRLVVAQARCELNGNPVGPRDSKRLCGVDVTNPQQARDWTAGSVSAQKMSTKKFKVTANPSCSTGLKVRVRIVVKETGKKANEWKKRWGANSKTPIRCSLKATG